MTQDRYALTYRADEACRVMEWIKAGQSGCILGLRGAGKSNFLRFLLLEEVRRRYLGKSYADTLFILVNMLSLTERTEWAVYELILDRLMGQVHLGGVGRQAVEELTSLHREVTRHRDPLIARRAVERCVSVLCEPSARHLVLFLDEFDAVFRELSPSLFRCLRAIRDDHKDQVSYITVTFGELPKLRDDAPEVEHFCRLVDRNVCYLGPYGKEDARQMIRYLASRRSVIVSEEDVARLFELSGGHAGLLKATLSLIWDRYRPGITTEIAKSLVDEPVIEAECHKIWKSLTENEQMALCALAREMPVDPDTFNHLKRRGLARQRDHKRTLFSSAFAGFVRLNGPPPVAGTIVSRSPRIVQIDGQMIEELSELEFEVLCYLYEHRGCVCTKQDLIEAIYRQQYDQADRSINDARLQQVVARLRAKIEPDSGHPIYILTVRREGYRFTDR